MYTISDINYTIAGPFLTLDFLYLVFGIVAFLRWRTIYQMKDRFSLGLIFYLSIGIHCFYRFATFQVTTIITIETIPQKTPDLERITKNIAILIYSSDITFWVIFLIFFWQLLVLLYVGHISKSTVSFSNEPNTPPPLRIRSVILFISIISFYVSYQCVIIALYDQKYYSTNVYIFINSISNLSVPVCIAISELYFHKKFSGLPYKSLFFQRRKQKLNYRIVYWAFGRTFHGVLDLIVLNFNAISSYIKFPETPGQISDYDYNMMTISVLIILIDKLLFELFPFLLVFDMDFVKIFFKINVEKISEMNDDLIDKNLIEENKTTEDLNKNNEKTSNNTKYSTFIEKDLEITKYEFDSLKFLPCKEIHKKRNNMGTIQYAILNDGYEEDGRNSEISINSSNSMNHISTRCIDLKSLSPYLSEGIMRDMKFYWKLQSDPALNLQILRGFSIYNHELYLIFEDYSNGSLNSLIHRNNEKNGILSFQFKIKLASQIAESMKALHELNPSIIHGHLTSKNILFDKDFFPKISDLLFNDLKKYCAISLGYTNKSAYTPPELLKDNSSVVNNCKASADVYSFGMILWEIFVEKEPFKNIKLKDLRKIVVEDNSRPKIIENLPFNISNLIRCCWQQEPEKRPNFKEISESLKTHFFLHELSYSSV